MNTPLCVIKPKGCPCTTQATAGYELDPDNASILVAGGGGVALQVSTLVCTKYI